MSKPNTQKPYVEIIIYVQRRHSLILRNKDLSSSSLNTLPHQVNMFTITMANQVPPSEQVTAHSRM
jgi:hypothetical protein